LVNSWGPSSPSLGKGIALKGKDFKDPSRLVWVPKFAWEPREPTTPLKSWAKNNGSLGKPRSFNNERFNPNPK